MSQAVPSPGGSPSRQHTALRAGVALAALAAVGLAALAVARAMGRPGREEPPRLFVLPDFDLVERSGRPVTLASLRGRPWVADFIFTRCAGVCPAMTARMARLRRELPEELRLVSFTVDPGHDTPETLARYADGFGAGPDWLFVTGPQPRLYALSVSGFKLAAMEVPPAEQEGNPDGPFLHSSRFVLVDAAGAVRGYYDSAVEEEMAALAADARLLAP